MDDASIRESSALLDCSTGFICFSLLSTELAAAVGVKSIEALPTLARRLRSFKNLAKPRRRPGESTTIKKPAKIIVESMIKAPGKVAQIFDNSIILLPRSLPSCCEPVSAFITPNPQRIIRITNDNINTTEGTDDCRRNAVGF